MEVIYKIIGIIVPNVIVDTRADGVRRPANQANTISLKTKLIEDADCAKSGQAAWFETTPIGVEISG